MSTRPSDAGSYGEWLHLTREHDGSPQPTKNKWKAGDLCMVDGRHIQRQKGKMYNAKILDTAFSSEGDYLQVQLEITAKVTGLNGREIEQTWTHNKPVQSYKLRKPLLK